jgi:hypothetical protein
MTQVRSTVAAALLVSLLSAQTTFEVPNQTGLPTVPGSGLPLAGTPMRYQQIYKAADIRLSVNPVRIRGVSFAVVQGGQTGRSVTMDLAIAHASPFPSSVFANNILSDRIQILTQQTITLPSPSVVGFTVNIPFPSQPTQVEFLWNGVDDIILDFRVISNSNSNQAFNYPLETVQGATTAVHRIYAPGANSTVGTIFQDGIGLRTRFDYATGIVLPYGQGCPGQGNVTPQGGALGTPLVGTLGFQWLLTRARPQMPVLLMLGYSRTAWGSVPLPLDLTAAGAPGCLLQTNPLLFFGTASVGGPGNGTATVPFPIPAITAYRGIQLTTQWLVVDDAVNSAGFVLSRPVLIVIG